MIERLNHKITYEKTYEQVYYTLIDTLTVLRINSKPLTSIVITIEYFCGRGYLPYLIRINIITIAYSIVQTIN